MVTQIRIYYEGSRLLKPGFSEFFAEFRSRAKARRCSINFISAGAGSETCRDFGIALKTHADAWNILLKDSEGPHDAKLSILLCHEHGWNKSHANSIFWMVQMMESWFHADKEALKGFYGEGFNKNAMKSNLNVEEISKADLESGLKNATRRTKAGSYFDNKTLHGPKLLAAIDPKLVRAAASNCDKIFNSILTGLT